MLCSIALVFGCPGTLIGIGLNKTFLTSMQPGPGSWSKDPILESNRTFFIPEGEQSVQVYDDYMNKETCCAVLDFIYSLSSGT